MTDELPDGPPDDPPLAEKLHVNIAALKKQGAPRERIQQELDRFQQKFDSLSNEDKKLSGWEQVGAGAQNVLQGASFGFSDDILSKIPGVDKDEQSLYKQQLKDNPAIGYGAQFAGGLLTPPVLKVAKGASTLAKIGTTLGEGAIQGGLAAAGTNEGGFTDRLKAAASGAGTGAAITGGLAGVVKGGASVINGAGRKLGMTVPKLADLVAESPTVQQDLAGARGKLEKAESLGLGDEVMAADVLPQGEGMLRSAATSNKAIRKDVDAALGQRSNRLANRADEAFSDATGAPREGTDKSIADFIDARKKSASPLYDKAAEEGAAFDNLVNTMQQPPSKSWTQKLNTAYNDPVVQRSLDTVKGMEDPATRRRLQHTYPVLAAIRKDLSADIGAEMQAGPSAASRSTLRGLRLARDKVDATLGEMAPSHAKAVEQFSDESELLDAFNTGSKAGKQDPSLIAADVAARKGTPAGDALRKGHAAAFRDLSVPNMDLGEFARMHDATNPIKTKDAAARFKAAFGEEKYNRYRDQLIGMVELQRLKAGKGESSTVDKLLEQADADPVALARALALMAGGAPAAGAASLGKGLGRSMLDMGARSKQGAENALALTARGHAPGTPARGLLQALQDAQAAAQIPARPTGTIPRATQSVARIKAQ